jgi:DNA topoisomerase-1
MRKELVPTFVAFAVTALLENHFEKLVDLNFTAEMEQTLDDIAAGEADWLEYLRKFYLGKEGLANQVQEKEATIDPREVSQVKFEDLPAEIRIGQFGPFLAKEENGERKTASLPPKLPPADLTNEMIEEILSQKNGEPEVLGEDPVTGQPVLLKVGPYGPYIQLGHNGDAADSGKKAKKPKRVSLLKGMDPNTLDLETALKLLSLPRTLGTHPETGKDVKAGVGRYGPFIVHDGKFVSLKPPDDVLEVTLERALELLAAAPSKGGSSKTVLKDLGVHPEDKEPVVVMDGRYGPYIKHKRTNVSLPKDLSPEDVTLEQAVEMLAAKVASKGKKTTRRRKAKK